MTPKTITLVLSIICMISVAINIGLAFYASYLIDACRITESTNEYLREIINNLDEFIEDRRAHNE